MTLFLQPKGANSGHKLVSGGRLKPRGRRNQRQSTTPQSNTQAPTRDRVHVFLPRSTVPQRKDIPFNERPPYYYGRCEKCKFPGHEKKDCDKLQQHRNTIKFYIKRFHRERKRTMNVARVVEPQSQSQTQTPRPVTTTPTTGVTTTPTNENSFFTQQ